MLKDRKEAGTLLGRSLGRLKLHKPVLLGIPRGGVVVVVAEAARHLGCELDMVLVRKIGMPDDPEFALGAVDEQG